jgi:hypothetical protein
VAIGLQHEHRARRDQAATLRGKPERSADSRGQRTVRAGVHASRPPQVQGQQSIAGHTPDEIKAAWDGALAHFGTWSVSEADKTVLLRVDGSFYPNQEGNEDKRVVNSLTADELHFLNAASSAGGQTEAMFRLAK